jgi:hypothetical protein
MKKAFVKNILLFVAILLPFRAIGRAGKKRVIVTVTP